MQEQLVFCGNLIKIYKVDELEVVALQGLDLEVTRGEMIALVGASGSGKTTLMNILGGLDMPSAGRCTVGEYDLTRLNEEQRTRYRNLVTGYLWQQSGRNLLPDLTIIANVKLPQLLNGTSSVRAQKRAHELLELVGLPTHAQKRPFQLSGGEQQRVAIAVALANAPALLLADEPTGEVDSLTAQELLDVLRQINTELGQTMILVTHDSAVAARVDRTLAIQDGRTSTETIRRAHNPSEQRQATTIGHNPQLQTQASPISPSAFPDIVQLLGQMLEQHDLDTQVRIQSADDHLELWPADIWLNKNERERPGGISSIIGLSLDSHRELILVDRTGRLQLPKEALALIPPNSRVEIQVAGDRVTLRPFSVSEPLARGHITRMEKHS